MREREVLRHCWKDKFKGKTVQKDTVVRQEEKRKISGLKKTDKGSMENKMGDSSL